ncbi:MAG: BatA domain-containing protein [Flavobacteriales bacterium]|nr:BatA and WFA domain-containing protein [Flavobacteriales bacterium]MCB9168606.1 BatA domain-containing protein [Flavobacteriales bacterium]
MAFLYPGFLWALTALAIPVLIHLFQLRRFKRIDFPDIRLLQQVTQQTRSLHKVRHWLVLLARTGALAALVLAFARPYIPREGTRIDGAKSAVSLFIDDSFSMDGQNAGGRLLDQARRAAGEVVSAYRPTDRFQVITGRQEARQQLLLGREEALDAIGQVEVGAFAPPLSQVLMRQAEALSRAEKSSHKRFLFTDLQRRRTDIDRWVNDTLMPTVIVPLPLDRVSDLSVDSAWFDTPVRRAGRSESLHVRITNHGEDALENIPLRLTIDGRQRAMGSFAVNGMSSTDTVLHYTQERAGAHWGSVTVNDPPVVFDDRLDIGYTVAEQVNVLLIGGELESDKAIAAVFRSDSSYAFRTVTPRELDPAMLEQADLVVLNGITAVPGGLMNGLVGFVEGGGSLFDAPPLAEDTPDHADLLGRLAAGRITGRDTVAIGVDRIDLDLPFYREVFTELPRNVDLPKVRERARWDPRPGGDMLLRLRDGSPFLTVHASGRGQVYFCAAPLDDRGGNFIRHALFVTTLLRMAELSRSSGALYHIIGREDLIPIYGPTLSDERMPELHGPDGITVLPELRRQASGQGIIVHGADLPVGPYALMIGTDTVGMIALVLSRDESDLSAYSPDELRDRLAGLGLTAFSVADAGPGEVSLSSALNDRGSDLWKWFVLIALLLLAAEVVLIRTSP